MAASPHNVRTRSPLMNVHTLGAGRLSSMVLAGSVLVVGCGEPDADPVLLDTPTVEAALEAIDPEAIERHIRVLADDSLQGRAPGTRGFAGAAQYAEATLQALGLEPAGVGGTYRQPVALRGSVRRRGVERHVDRWGVGYPGARVQ